MNNDSTTTAPPSASSLIICDAFLFPVSSPAWTTAVNGQWETGWNFIYHIGNNADAILFWARLPILLLAVGFCFALYELIRRRWGAATALLVVFFYALSPTFIGHAGLVTTDVGASIFIFLALLAFVPFIEKPSPKRLSIFALALAGAQLAKFSGFLLYPFLGLAVLVVGLVWTHPYSLWPRVWYFLSRYLLACIVSLVLVYLYYAPQVMNMPTAVQDNLISGSLSGTANQPVVHGLVAMNRFALARPMAQYLLGVAMVFRRVTGGNVTYFNGVAQNGGFRLYFPELFVVKTQVSFLLLGLVALFVPLVAWVKRRPLRPLPAVVLSLRAHLAEWILGGFATFYFGVAMLGNLDLGIRHILPIYLSLFALVAIVTVKLMRQLAATSWQMVSAVGLALLLFWYGLSAALIYPSYLAYFNELIGGSANAGQHFSDSSVDWGQDLRRLVTYVKQNHIDHIAVDYFGGGDPRYYFCQRIYHNGVLQADADGYNCDNSPYMARHAEDGPYTGQYIAVSETFLENDRYYAQLNHRVGYGYLRALKPVAKIGYSIYVYKLY